MMCARLTLAVGPQQKVLLPQQPSDRITPNIKPLTTQNTAQFPQ
jgi:hypothetical protein